MINDEQLKKDCLQLMKQISQGAELNEVLSNIIQSIEHRFSPNQSYVTYYNVDIHGERLIHLASSSSQERPTHFGEQFETVYFNELSKELQLGKTVMISKDDQEGKWSEIRSFMNHIRYETAITVPIFSSYQYLLGILVMMFRKSEIPDLETIQIVKQYNQIASIAIEVSQQNKNSKQQKHSVQQGYEWTDASDQSKCLSELKHALDKEQFVLYYQPYYGFKKKEFGLEALIRWKHPKYGLLSPASFIETAERTRFIIELEEWVLQKAITDVKQLEKKGLEDIHLSVNISAQQFENEKYPNKIMKVLDHHSFDPHQLTLEITERFLVHENSISEVEKVKDLGVRISIDDFGTSYSSLHYLKDLPIDELKIDRSFISNIDVDLNNRKIVEMIIMLGHQLNITTVAEGIETIDQYDILKGIDCDRAQGFLLSKPVPIEKIIPAYKNYHHRFLIEK